MRSASLRRPMTSLPVTATRWRGMRSSQQRRTTQTMPHERRHVKVVL